MPGFWCDHTWAVIFNLTVAYRTTIVYSKSQSCYHLIFKGENHPIHIFQKRAAYHPPGVLKQKTNNSLATQLLLLIGLENDKINFIYSIIERELLFFAVVGFFFVFFFSLFLVFTKY